MNDAVVSGLRHLGFDCLTCDYAGNRSLGDEAQLAFALAADRVIVTQNVGDYSALHRRWMRVGRSHAGIIVLTVQRTPPGVQIRAVERVNRAFDDLRDQLIFLLSYA